MTAAAPASSAQDFSPALTFECGQCFRFGAIAPGVYRGAALGRSWTVSRASRGALITCAGGDPDRVGRDFFDLDRDYAAIRRAVSVTPFMAAAADFGRGLRILRQDFWEALCSFLISQCNNIPRIKGIIGRLCEGYGAPIEEGSFAFPDAPTVARLNEGDLRALDLGYRAPYVLGAARAVAEGRVTAGSLHALPLAEARHALAGLEGVGAKVADCVLLYGLHRLDAFPIDTWIRRALAEHFPKGFSHGVFGAYAGVAQQYIFHYARHLRGKAG